MIFEKLSDGQKASKTFRQNYRSCVNRFTKVGYTDLAEVYKNPMQAAQRLYDAKYNWYNAFESFKALKTVWDIAVSCYNDEVCNVSQDAKTLLFHYNTDLVVKVFGPRPDKQVNSEASSECADVIGDNIDISQDAAVDEGFRVQNATDIIDGKNNQDIGDDDKHVLINREEWLHVVKRVEKLTTIVGELLTKVPCDNVIKMMFHAYMDDDGSTKQHQ